MNIGLHLPPPARVIPWGNGLGESRELLTGSGWRISTTWIERDCAFSHYPGRRRRIVLMKGAGFRLDFVAHPSATLATVGDSADFSGAWSTACSLVAGRVQALNIILDEAFEQSNLAFLGTGEVRLGSHAKALFCVAGSARAGNFELEAGDVLSTEAGATVQVQLEHGSFLLEIGFFT